MLAFDSEVELEQSASVGADTPTTAASIAAPPDTTASIASTPIVTAPVTAVPVVTRSVVTAPVVTARVAIVPPARRTPWTRIAMALVIALAAIQTALIAAWWASGRIATPETDTGSLTITSEPAGARVTIDGTPGGTTPYAVTLPAGTHQLEIGSGAQLRTQSITVGRGRDLTVHASLAPELPSDRATPGATTGGLQISTDPDGARVSVDGQPRGNTPITVGGLSPGPHQIAINVAGNVVTRRVTVQPGTTASVIVSIAANAGATGWLAVRSGVSAQIIENGTLVGTTDTPRIMLPSGRHDLVISNEALGYSVSHAVQIGAGETVSLQLETPRGTLGISALPWADVWVDGQSVGETPIASLSLPIGTHEVVFRHPEFGEQRRTVTVTATGVVRVGVDFRR